MIPRRSSFTLRQPEHSIDGRFSPHRIQGIGAGFVPSIYNAKVVDRIADVSWDDAVDTERPGKQEGILAGISSGAILRAAIQVAKDLGEGKRVVAVLPDCGERCLSTPLHKYTDVVDAPATKAAPAGV